MSRADANVVQRLTTAVRRFDVRHAWLHWVVVAAVAIALASTVLDRLDRVDAAAAAWGETTRVWVVSGSVEPGEPVLAVARDVPIALVPEGAIDQPFGLMARQRIGPGRIVTSTDVTARNGPLGLVPDGWLAVPVVESPRSGALVGDHVVAVSDGFTVSEEAIVVALHEDVTLVAVPAAEAPLLPAAADAGSLTLVLRP